MKRNKQSELVTKELKKKEGRDLEVVIREGRR